MKNINRILAATLCSALAFSCSMYEPDNYDAPDCTINGVIVDQDGKSLQVEHGGGARIKLLDFGYSDTPQEQYLKVKKDGSFINTKIFNSTYDIVAEGPFVPLVQVNDQSEIIVDKSLKGVRKKDFKNIKFVVEPYLKVDWVAEPLINSDNTVTVRFRLDRGTDNPSYQKPMKDVTLFISTTQSVGNSDFLNYSIKAVKGDAADEMLGQENELTCINDSLHPLEPGRPYYIRVGARMNFTGPWGADHYNYTTVKKIVLPKK